MLIAIWNVMLELSPWLLFGALIAGLMHVMLPPNFIHRQLSGRWSVFKAVALGVPLPLCSCGVIPAGLGLKKDGASDGASVGFLISTPQTGVDSILVSASFLGWPFALFKVVAAAVTGIVGGVVTDRLGTSHPEPVEVDPRADSETLGGGVQELMFHSVQLIRTIWRWLAVGVVFSAAIEVFVPHDMLAALASMGNLGAMLVVLAISTPLYVCATSSVPIAAALVASGLPTGAALVFLMAGPATNVATIGAIYRGFGARALWVYLTTIIGGSVGFGLAFDALVVTTGKAGMEHHVHDAWWAVASAVLLVGLFVWFGFEELRRWLLQKNFITVTEESVVEIGVDGMSCGGCVSRLENVLRSEEGVSSAVVTLEPGKAVIHGPIEEARIREVIRGAGFEPV